VRCLFSLCVCACGLRVCVCCAYVCVLCVCVFDPSQCVCVVCCVLVASLYSFVLIVRSRLCVCVCLYCCVLYACVCGLLCVCFVFNPHSFEVITHSLVGSV